MDGELEDSSTSGRVVRPSGTPPEPIAEVAKASQRKAARKSADKPAARLEKYLRQHVGNLERELGLLRDELARARSDHRHEVEALRASFEGKIAANVDRHEQKVDILGGETKDYNVLKSQYEVLRSAANTRALFAAVGSGVSALGGAVLSLGEHFKDNKPFIVGAGVAAMTIGFVVSFTASIEGWLRRFPASNRKARLASVDPRAPDGGRTRQGDGPEPVALKT